MKFSDYLICFILYIFVGVLVGMPIDIFVMDGKASNMEVTALILAWPVFAVKYLTLGIWEIIQAFIYLIGL